MTAGDDLAGIDRLLGYFDPQVLLPYQNEPDKYTVTTDHFVGRVTTNPEFYEQQGGKIGGLGSIDVLFGYRTLKSGDLALMAWLPDLFEKSKGHVERWRGFVLREPEWGEEHDERFSLWVQRYIRGSWRVRSGPLYQVVRLVGSIRSLTEEVVGTPLFKHPIPETLGYPTAQINHRYQDAHRNLYGHIIDGLDRDAITLLAELRGESIKIKSDRTVDGLRKAFPDFSEESPLWDAFKVISEQRRLAAHSVRPPVARMPAFEQFTEDLQLLERGLKDLLSYLEGLTGFDARSATARTAAKAMLPEITGPPEAHYSINQVRSIVGRTVERVEYGFRAPIEGVHQSEAIIIHFTDGSALGIDTGSNAFNVALDHREVDPSQFHVDLHLTWVPPLSSPASEAKKADQAPQPTSPKTDE